MLCRLQEELSDVKEKWDRHIAEISRENVTRDLELSSALEEQQRLKLELDQRKDDLQRLGSCFSWLVGSAFILI